MKFLVALLAALPAAVLAAPSAAARQDNPEHPFVMDSIACGCVTATGKVDTLGYCQYQVGDSRSNLGELSNLCYKRAAWAYDMDFVFSPEYCATRIYNGIPSKSVCKPIRLCDNYDGGWGPCGY